MAMGWPSNRIRIPLHAQFSGEELELVDATAYRAQITYISDFEEVSGFQKGETLIV